MEVGGANVSENFSGGVMNDNNGSVLDMFVRE
jgi:hypothetical protein